MNGNIGQISAGNETIKSGEPDDHDEARTTAGLSSFPTATTHQTTHQVSLLRFRITVYGIAWLSLQNTQAMIT